METQRIEIKRGLDLPITGQPKQEIDDARQPGRVALVGTDYAGMKPQFAVSIGDSVKLGDLIFTDKKRPSIRYTSPGAGKVIQINRGEKRMLLSVVIALEGNDETTFNSYSEPELPSLNRKKVVDLLLEYLQEHFDHHVQYKLHDFRNLHRRHNLQTTQYYLRLHLEIH